MTRKCAALAGPNLFLLGACTGLALLAFLAVVSLLAPPARADSPQVETGGSPCPAFNSEHPELCGIISLPGGGDVSYYFEYGTSAIYGQQAPAQPVELSIPSDEPTKVTVPLSGLQPEVKYHYRLVVSDGSGTYAGADATFTTPAIPEPPLVETWGPRCSAFDPEHPELCGVITLPDGGDVSYHFEFGPSLSYGQQAPAQPVEISIPSDEPTKVTVPLSGLQPEVKYHYRLVVSDGSGTYAGADATFTTPAAGGGGPGPETPAPETPVVPGADAPSVVAVPPLGAVGIQQAAAPKGQPLVRALKRCRARPKQRRTACERRIRQRYYAAHAASDSG